MKLPIKLTEKFFAEKIHLKPYTVLLLDHTFKLLEMESNDGGVNTGSGTVSSGDILQTLESVYLFLEGTIPDVGQITYLPNIEISRDFYANTYIYTESDERLWVVLVDNTEEINELREVVQTMNEAMFKNNVTSFEKNNREVEIALLNSMDYAVFLRKRGSKELFIRLGKSPHWLQRLTEERRIDWGGVDLADLFPYIEVFFVEAQHTWHSDRFLKTASNVWTEFDASGEEYFLQAFAVNLNDHDYILISPTDISIEERQSLIQKAREKSLDYERLEKAEAALKKLIGFKDQFISMVSHDLRAPLGMLAVYANRLTQKGAFKSALDDKQFRSLQSISNELNRLTSYVNKLYHWSTLEFGKFELYRKDVQLTLLVENSLKVFEQSIERKGLKVGVEIPESLSVNIDESLFEQVLNNLIGNAVKFTGNGNCIYITADNENDSPVMRIKDEGVGMSESVRDSVFKEVVTEHTLGTDGESGSGLGLKICKQIIDLHEFEVDFASNAGEGTEFIITFASSGKSTDSN